MSQTLNHQCREVSDELVQNLEIVKTFRTILRLSYLVSTRRCSVQM